MLFYISIPQRPKTRRCRTIAIASVILHWHPSAKTVLIGKTTLLTHHGNRNLGLGLGLGTAHHHHSQMPLSRALSTSTSTYLVLVLGSHATYSKFNNTVTVTQEIRSHSQQMILIWLIESDLYLSFTLRWGLLVPTCSQLSISVAIDNKNSDFWCSKMVPKCRSIVESDECWS